MTTRRLVLGWGLSLAGGIALAQPAPPVLVASRAQVLNDTAAARRLREAEIAMTAALQQRIDAVKAELSAEEAALTAERGTLAREIFDARVEAFDQKVRRERRQTQRRAAALQTAFREARRKLVDQLGPVLDRVRAERGALVILNADDVVAAAPGIDVTADVIAMFDRVVPLPEVPDLDALDPGPEPFAPIEAPETAPPE